MVALIVFSAKRNCGGWAFILCCVDDFGLTWLPHSRYPWIFWAWTKTCFFSHHLDKDLEGTPTKHFKVSSTAGVEVQHFGRGLWNTGKGFLHPSLKLLLSIFSKEGWRKYRQGSFCTFPIDSKAICQVVSSPPPLPPHLHKTQKQSPLLHVTIVPVPSLWFLLAYFLLFQIVIRCVSLFFIGGIFNRQILQALRGWGTATVQHASSPRQVRCVLFINKFQKLTLEAYWRYNHHRPCCPIWKNRSLS